MLGRRYHPWYRLSWWEKAWCAFHGKGVTSALPFVPAPQPSLPIPPPSPPGKSQNVQSLSAQKSKMATLYIYNTTYICVLYIYDRTETTTQTEAHTYSIYR